MGSKKKAKKVTRKKATKKKTRSKVKEKDLLEAKKELQAKERENAKLKSLAEREKRKAGRERKLRQSAEWRSVSTTEEDESGVEFNEDEAIGLELQDDGGEDSFAFGSSPGFTEDVGLTSGRDVFKEAEAILIPKGDFPQFAVYRNGAYEGRIQHPCDWDKIKDEMGPGQYKVQAVSTNSGRIVKTESRLIGSISEAMKAKEEKEEPLTQPPAPQPQVDMDGLLRYATQMANLNFQSKKEDDRFERKSQSDLSTSTVTLIMEQNKSTQEMFRMIQQSTGETVKALSDNFGKLITEIRSESKESQRDLREQLKALTQKPEFGIKEILTLVNSSRDEGVRYMKDIQDMVEARVEIMNDKEPSQPESWSDNLLKNIAPIVAQGMMKPQQPAYVDGPTQPQVLAQPAYSQPAQQDRGAGYPVQSEVGSSQAQNGVSQTQSQEATGSNLSSRHENGERHSGPVIDFPLNDEGVDFVEESNGVAQTESKEVLENKIQALILPIISDKLGKVAPSVAAIETLDLLGQDGISQKDVLEVFPFDRIMDIAGSFLSEDQLPWIEEFYGHIETHAGNVDRGAAPSGELSAH